jgi:phenylacetate-CoA ligase
MRAWLTSKCIFPLYHRLRSDGLMPAILHLEEDQWWSPERLREQQAAKLARLLEHCNQHVPYYRKLFSTLRFSARDLSDPAIFRQLPPLEKEVIRAHQDELRATNIDGSQIIRNSTSGSTGEPLFFYQDRISGRWRQAVVWRNQAWVGAMYSDREARLWGAQMDIEKTESIRGRLHSWLHQKVFLSSYTLSDEAMRRYAGILTRFRPKLLISYPSPLALFAQFARDNSVPVPRIDSIITSAEQLYPWQREIIEDVFRARVFDRYGSREFGNIAHQCEEGDGYHVNTERFVVEVIDRNGVPAANGEIGEIYITDLDNYGFPFVRYPIGDLAVQMSEHCACGRGLPLLKRIEGRSFDVVECPDGRRVAGTYWTIAVRRIPGVLQFQVVQDQPDHLIMRLCTGEGWCNDGIKAVESLVEEGCGTGMRVTCKLVDQIELTKSGKRRLVINQLHA